MAHEIVIERLRRKGFEGPDGSADRTLPLKGVENGTLRVVFLFDAGSSLLRWPHKGTMEVRGDHILQHALQKLGIDVICVFSPQWKPPGVFEPAPGTHRWEVQIYDSRCIPSEVSFSDFPISGKSWLRISLVSLLMHFKLDQCIRTADLIRRI